MRLLMAIGILVILVSCFHVPRKTTNGASEAAGIQSELRETSMTAEQAYREVLAFAAGIPADQVVKNKPYLDALYAKLDKAAGRNLVVTEFALAVVAAEAQSGTHLSWARNDSWTTYETVTQHKVDTIPDVLNDLDTATSELNLALRGSKTVEEAYGRYWCGPQRAFNTDSLAQFSETASRLWNGLEPYACEHKANKAK